MNGKLLAGLCVIPALALTGCKKEEPPKATEVQKAADDAAADAKKTADDAAKKAADEAAKKVEEEKK